MAILLFLYYCFFTFIAWRNIRLAIALVVFSLPSYLIRFHIFGIPATLLEGMILILFFVWMLKKRDLHFLDLAYTLPIGLFLIAGAIATIISPDTRAALGIFKAYIIEPILFFIVFIDTAKHSPLLANPSLSSQERAVPRTEPKGSSTGVGVRSFDEVDFMDLIIISLASSAFIISIIAIYQYFTGWMIPPPWQNEAVRRVTSVYGFPNAVGLYLAPIVVLLIGWLSATANRKSLIANRHGLFAICYLLFATITALAAIVFARSEGALAGIAAGLFLFGILHKSFRRWTIVSAMLLVFLVLLIVPVRMYVWKQMTFANASGIARHSQWNETLSMLKDHPITGAGLSGYKQTLLPYHKATHIEIYQYPHNLILNFWSEMGILGLLSFLWLVDLFYQKGIHEMRKIRQKTEEKNHQSEIINLKSILVASMTTLLIHGLVDVPYFKNDLSIFFWLLFGMMILVSPLKVRGDEGEL